MKRMLLLIAALMVVGCAAEDNNPAGELGEVRSNKARITTPQVSDANLTTLTSNNRDFAVDLYHEVRDAKPGNLFLSPHSISTALAMTYAGAEGNTETEMAQAMHFTLPESELHPAFNKLDLELESRAKTAPEEGGNPFRLEIANALFGQADYGFLDTFLDTLALNYGAGMRLLDFMADPEGSRETINVWVEDKTEDRIQDLLPQGSITGDTRLVLVNAIYFNASWSSPFEESATADATFTRLDGSTLTTPMMAQVESFPFTTGEGFSAVAMPYAGNELSMVFILPDEGTFESFEVGLTGASLGAILEGLNNERVELKVPKFEFTADFGLSQALQNLGMRDAFSSGAADLSGMDGSRSLFIMDVIHKAFVAIDEEGTEAAAATAVTVGTTSVPPPPTPMALDRPFLFLIQDHATGAILFLGRVVDPSAT